MTNSLTHQHDRNIEQGKFEIDAADSAIDTGAPLPEGYGDNRLVIMTRDPFWFFAYWEITQERAEQIRVSHGQDCWDQTAFVLRVYDLGESAQLPVESAPHFDVDVHKFARQWYVEVPRGGNNYVADLGLRWANGKFVSLFRSNTIRQPAGQVSTQIDSQWMTVGMTSELHTWENMALMALGDSTSKGASTHKESGQSMALRWEFFKAVFSGSVPRWPSSWPSSKASK